MTLVHGKDAFFSLDGTDLSPFMNSIDETNEADSHDVTTYGKQAHVFAGGLRNGTVTIEGFYDSDSTTGPRGVIKPLIGTLVQFVYQPEGVGPGLPQDMGTVLVTNYEETTPVDDMITWSSELQFSDDVISSVQAA